MTGVDLSAALPYREVWLCDFEFIARDGERPEPVCMVAQELRTGRVLRLWRDELRSMNRAPLDTGPGSLFVAYFASAELGCFLALDWPMPARVLDLYAEFRVRTNGRSTPRGRGLLGALAWFGLDSMAAEEKDDMRALILSGGPWSADEQAAILDYCAADVAALAALLPAMLPGILGDTPTGNLGRALLRGRYMAAAARVEWAGVPIDTDTLERLRAHWDELKARLIADVNADYGVFDGLTFKQDRFAAWLAHAGIPWPRLPSGALDMQRDTFRDQARAFPQVAPLYELRHALSELRLHRLAVGRDGRNRALVSPFGARSGRNTPSAARFIFGPSRWLRSLIKPRPGYALAYVDFSSQEFAIAAGLSADPAMGAAYESGDVYLAFAKQAGLAPAEATKATHKAVRDRCKALVLGVQYGMQANGLARRLDALPMEARSLLRAHEAAYPRFWEWSRAAVDTAMLKGQIQSAFGWTLHLAGETNSRSLQNFPMQAGGADMLRLAACMATERGLTVCAMVHDALLLEAPVDRLAQDVAELRAYMAEAGRLVTGGLEVRTDVSEVVFPARYSDERGADMWDRVRALLSDIEQGRTEVHKPVRPP